MGSTASYLTSGTTTGSYIVASILYGAEGPAHGAIVLIKNTHVSATMYYKISLYLANEASALESTFLAETGLAASTTADMISITYPFYKAEISVKQHSGAGTYQIDAITF